jgi:hypothetical protein
MPSLGPSRSSARPLIFATDYDPYYARRRYYDRRADDAAIGFLGGFLLADLLFF